MNKIKFCRACWSEDLTEILDLGNQHVSDFRDDDSRTNQHPLIALICSDCFLVQLSQTTPSAEMYHENYGFKSGINDSIKADLQDVVSTALEFCESPRAWLDIASNDGTLLSYVPSSIHRTGVDPITKYCQEAEQHADRIVNGFFDLPPFTSYADHGEAVYDKFDVITAVSCFYDMDRPNDFVSDVSKVLARKGAWVIQQNYLLPTLQMGAIDNFCHEHIEYYTLLSLEPLLARHKLEVIDVSTSMVNGGSIRTIVAHKGEYPIQDSVEQQRTIELDAGLDKLTTYQEFADKALSNIADLKALVNNLVAAGSRIAILAASTRGSTIWQCAGFTDKEIDFAVERNPEKVGKWFSAIGIRIVSEEEARERFPDYMIIGPWFFQAEIIDREQAYLKAGGKLIVPLPSVEVI